MRKCCMLLMIMAATGCFAQKDSVNQLSFSMNLLTHGEACGGGLPRSEDTGSEEDESYFMVGRVRMNVDYQRPGLQAHAVIQNKGLWGMKGNNAVTLYEGWVKLTAKNGLFAQAGRIALAYDDERIIGPNDFATAAQSHDVLRIGYEGHGHKAHAILAYNQNGDNYYNGTYYKDGSQLYKTMQTLWYHYDVPKFPLEMSLLFMNIGLQAGRYKEVDDGIEIKKVADQYNMPRTEYQQIYGGRISYHPKHLTLEGSYYRQAGKVVNEEKYATEIKAWMVSAKATIKPTDKYGFVLGYDYLSGDDYVPVIHGGSFGMPYHEYEGGFAPLYGSRTKFYGILDYFYESAYINGFTPGLQNAFVGINYSPNNKFTCSATYHYLATATELHNLDRTLGHSIELEAKYKFSKDISLTAGYTQMTGTETMDRLKQGDSSKRARWGWFSLVISPSLFTTKW